ncbi:uncharacterized protein haspin [Hypomesus transpacificus]|uniref:uncharacterized protein haspin n=1 Tax=Hypomesus transpacificus TaxID=137520 RepID=UPI001F07F9EF|nr:uncharacterized protein haspin [Hypomesus transpacificus]
MDQVGRPLFMKTYGKQTRKIDAWIVPNNRKMTFDSTSSSTSDLSVSEPARTKSTVVPKRGKKTRVACRQGVRPAKAKAMKRLVNNSSDEENSFFPSPAPTIQHQNKPVRGKKTSVACSRSVRPAKSKETMHLTDEDSEGQNSLPPFRAPPIHQQQNKAARRVAGRKTKQTVSTSESEGDSLGLRKERGSQKRQSGTLGRGKRHSDAPPDAPLWPFVTRRRGAAAPKPQIPRSTRIALMPLQSLNSSDDFAQSGGSGGKVPFSRRPKQGQPWELTSAESPVAGPRNSSVTNDHLREISSLNDSADPCLKPCPRKPLFCSTPSLCPPPRPRHKSHCPSSLLPASVIDIVNLSITQEEMEVDPPEDPHCTSLFAPVLEPSPGVKHPSNLGEPGRTNCEEPPQLNMTNTRRSCNTEEKGHSKGIGIPNCAIEPQSLELFSLVSGNQTDTHRAWEETEGSVHFVSASGGLEEEQRRMGVTQRCVVLLERVDKPTNVTQPDAVTTYSSCVDHMRSVSSELSADRTNLIKLVFSTSCGSSSDRSGLSVETDDRLQSVSSIEGVDGSPLNGSKAMVGSQLDSNDLSEVFQSADNLELNNHTSNSLKSVDRSRLIDSDHSLDPTRSTDVEVGLDRLTATLKERCRTQQLAVSLENIVQPQTDLEDTLNIDQPLRVTKFSLNSPNDSQSSGSEVESVDQAVKRKRAAVPPKDQGKALKALNNVPVVPDHVPDGVPRPRNVSLAPQGKKRRSVSRERPGTTRKACVSGLSLSRWSKRDGASGGAHANNYHDRRRRRAAPQSGRPGDCSITELLSAHNMAPAKGAGMDSWLQPSGAVLSTPVRTGRLSSLLLDLTPDTHTWSRLKAALSIHKKTKAFFSPHHSNIRALTQEGAGLADVSQSLFGTPFRTPLPRCLTSQCQISTPLSARVDELSDAEKVYAECGQPKALAWEACLPPGRMKLCKKIGEGTFGEVFTTTNSTGDTVALKIIPLEGSEKVNGEKQKSFGEILHEIIISKELSSLKEKQKNKTHGFIGLNDLHCVRGPYPPTMLKAWDAFDRLRGSENDRPDFFEEDQLFLILEFEFGGSDLENSDGQLSSLVVAKSILHQVTAALAVAEQELCFEHRDLHWGNVLVKPTTEKQGVFLLDGTAHCLNTRGVYVRLIDYSLSRLEIDGLTVSCDISEDEELFMGQGDYQFDIYRIMRQENSNEWSAYQPHSNVLWLHYLCSKLLGMRYRGQGRGAKQTREDLTGFLNSVLHYPSAMQVLLNCPLFQ